MYFASAFIEFDSIFLQIVIIYSVEPQNVSTNSVTIGKLTQDL